MMRLPVPLTTPGALGAPSGIPSGDEVLTNVPDADEEVVL